MRSCTKKYWVLKFLTLVTIICIICPAAIAGGANDANKPPERAPFEQRMQKRISVEFRNTPIEDVIRIMANQAGVNHDFVPDPKLPQTVTLTLVDVTLEEALKTVLRKRGYDYVLTDNVINIITAAGKTEKPEILETRTYEIVYADVEQVVKALKEFVSKPNGLVSSIKGTSYIIATDTESKIRDITAFIEKIDRITPQILIEARIYDITSKDKLDLGVEWNAGRNTGYYTGTGFVVPPGTMGNTKTGDIEPFATGIFRGDTKKTESTTGVLKFGWLNDNVDIDMIIRAQQENIEAKLLANPRILVLDNEKATFDIVSEIPYIERTIGTTTTETVQYKKVGVKLEVTPHVARDGMLRLHIVPEFGVVVGYLSGAPIVDTRKVDTIALVKNGQTVVLGGLRKKDVKKQINKVPLLGDLPVVGALFRFTGEDSVNSEIVVFITTGIIKQQPVMSQSEQKAYEVTEFKGPEPIMTKAEKPEKAKE